MRELPKIVPQAMLDVLVLDRNCNRSKKLTGRIVQAATSPARIPRKVDLESLPRDMSGLDRVLLPALAHAIEPFGGGVEYALHEGSPGGPACSIELPTGISK